MSTLPENPAVPSPPKRRSLPSGTSSEEYLGYETWPDRRWAWEFLCRNLEFQSACDRLDRLSPDSKQYKRESRLVARTFHLRTYFHYLHLFQQGKSLPRFNPTIVFSKIPAGKDTRIIRAPISTGHILVRFDLMPALSDENYIAAELEYARKRLFKELALLKSNGVSKQKGRGTLNAIQGTGDDLLNDLRILDMQAPGLDANGVKITRYRQAEILMALFPHRIAPNDLNEGPRREMPAVMKSLERKAHRLAEHGYLALARSETRVRGAKKSGRPAVDLPSNQ